MATRPSSVSATTRPSSVSSVSGGGGGALPRSRSEILPARQNASMMQQRPFTPDPSWRPQGSRPAVLVAPPVATPAIRPSTVPTDMRRVYSSGALPLAQPIGVRTVNLSRGGLHLKSSTSSTGLSLASVMSPKQEEEAREFAARCSQRSSMLQHLNGKRDAAKQRAIARHETFWMRRERAEQHAALVLHVCDEALTAPVHFLPQLPEAAAIARQSWACEAAPFLGARAESEAIEARQLVEGLNDNTSLLTSAIDVWQKPGHARKFSTNLNSLAEEGKGRAPQPRHFKRVSELSLRRPSRMGGAPKDE